MYELQLKRMDMQRCKATRFLCYTRTDEAQTDYKLRVIYFASARKIDAIKSHSSGHGIIWIKKTLISLSGI